MHKHRSVDDHRTQSTYQLSHVICEASTMNWKTGEPEQKLVAGQWQIENTPYISCKLQYLVKFNLDYTLYIIHQQGQLQA